MSLFDSPEKPVTLHSAAWFGKVNIVKELLAHDANLSLRCNNGQSLSLPLQRSVWNGGQWNGGPHPKVTRILLAAGADPNTEWGDGTVLHDAAMQNQCEIAKELLSAGADPNACNDGNETPMDEAIWHNCSEVIQTIRFCQLAYYWQYFLLQVYDREAIPQHMNKS